MGLEREMGRAGQAYRERDGAGERQKERDGGGGEEGGSQTK